jgi:hypothetical protein
MYWQLPLDDLVLPDARFRLDDYRGEPWILLQLWLCLGNLPRRKGLKVLGLCEIANGLLADLATQKRCPGPR